MKRNLNLFQLLGIFLLAGSMGLLLFFRFQAKTAENRADTVTDRIESLLPESDAGLPGGYSDPHMPVLQIDGLDYAGLVEFPAYGVTLPVANDWEPMRIFSCPCRFYGSVYDSTMIIGGSDQAGQFDFFDRMDLGDKVWVTDMLGSCFSYTVSRIDRAESADYETLSAGEYPLTLFVRNAFGMEYILVRCSLPS